MPGSHPQCRLSACRSAALPAAAADSMHLVAIAWLYVVVAMAIAEATSPAGTLLGALFTFVLYGALPLAIVLYLLGTPGRRRRAADLEVRSAAAALSAAQPDGSGHAPGTAVAAEREKA